MKMHAFAGVGVSWLVSECASCEKNELNHAIVIAIISDATQHIRTHTYVRSYLHMATRPRAKEFARRLINRFIFMIINFSFINLFIFVLFLSVILIPARQAVIH